MRNMFLLLLVFQSLLFAATSRSPGVIDGSQPFEEAMRMSAGWYDMRVVVPATITSDTIKTDSLFGAGTIVRQFMNRTSVDGRVNVMCTKGTYFIAIPVTAGQSTGILPSMAKILKSGTTIDTLIFFIQKQDTLRR